MTQILPAHFHTLLHMCTLTVLRPVRVSQFCNAAGTCYHDTGIFLSLEDAGKTKDVRGLHEEAADDGRPQWALRGPDACPRESRGRWCQGCHRWTGKMFSPDIWVEFFYEFLPLTGYRGVFLKDLADVGLGFVAAYSIQIFSDALWCENDRFIWLNSYMNFVVQILKKLFKASFSFIIAHMYRKYSHSTIILLLDLFIQEK